MIIRLLGEVAVATEDGWQRAGPAKQSAVLAVLAMSAGHPVDRQTLVERIWGDTSPHAARSALYAYIARLRKALASHPEVTITRGDDDGYRLEAPLDQIDLYVVRGLDARARALAAAGSHEQAIPLWIEAAAVSHDRPLANLAGEWADRVRREIQIEQLSLIEYRFESELALGRHRQILNELTKASEANPHSQRLVGALMLALYCSGRPEAALGQFNQFSSRLRREMAAEPGSRLRELNNSIMSGDPSLELASSPAPASADRSAPRQLPPAAPRFVGRSTVVDQLTGLLDRGTVSMAAVVGMAGVGKTAVAVQWSHQVAQRFPDGQLYVDLKGFDPSSPRRPDGVLVSFLRSMGVPVSQIPDAVEDRIALYRSKTDNKRMLVVLDNAADADQVRALLPSGDDCFTLVTSRDALSGLVASEGAQRIRLDVLAPLDAVGLVRQMVAPHRDEVTNLDELVWLCGGLPLALRIAAADLVDNPERPVSDYVDELRRARLTSLSIAGDPRASVEPAFEISYRRMPETARRVFRMLGMSPGESFAAPVAAALADRPVPAAGMALRTMLAANLIEPVGSGRYRLHDLLREYAIRRSQLEDGPRARELGLRRLGSWYAHSAHNAAQMLRSDHLFLSVSQPVSVQPETFGDRDQALNWLDVESEAALSAMRTFAHNGMSEVAWLMADAWRGYYATRTEFDAWRETATLGLDLARREGDSHAQAAMGRGLGWYFTEKGDYRAALDHYRTALVAAVDAGADEWQAAIWAGMAAAHYRDAQLAEAAEACKQAIAVTTEPPRSVLNMLGITSRELGRLDESARTFERAVRLNRRDNSANLGVVLGNLAEPYRDLGRLAEARACVEEALELDETLGSLRGECHHRDELARILSELGDWSAAQREAARAMWLVDKLDLAPLRPQVLTTVAMAAMNRPSDAYERAKQALEAARRIDAAPVMLEAGLVQARALRQIDRVDEALPLAQWARQLAEVNRYRVQEGKALTELAKIHYWLDDPVQARSLADKALSMHRETGHRPGEARTLRLLAQLGGNARLDEEADDIFASTGSVDDG